MFVKSTKPGRQRQRIVSTTTPGSVAIRRNSWQHGHSVLNPARSTIAGVYSPPAMVRARSQPVHQASGSRFLSDGAQWNPTTVWDIVSSARTMCWHAIAHLLPP